MNAAQQNMLLQTQNQQGTVQSDQAMLSDQNNFVDTQNSSDPSKQITPKDQRTTVPTKPTKQQLLEAEIDKAFNEVFETDQTNPTEDNPHAAVFDEMADDLYQTMLQEQAKEETAAGLTPIPNQAKALDDSTQGWTSDSNIQYNDSGDTSLSQQEYRRQFWNETKNRFSAVKLLFDTQPYGSFQPAFAVAEGKDFHKPTREGNHSKIGFHAINEVYNNGKNLKENKVIWEGKDKYVPELANIIESKFPGKVKAVEKLLYDENNKLVTDLDIELENIIIQVKSGTAKGLTTQMINTAAATGKTVISYTPDMPLSSAILRGVRNKGFKTFTDIGELLQFLDIFWQ